MLMRCQRTEADPRWGAFLIGTGDAWQHEFGDDRFAFDSSLPNAAGNVFTVQGPRIGRDALLLGAGVTLQCNERTAIYVSYDAQLLRENYESHANSAGVRMTF